ncbi:MAG: Nif3-like dinuclear metal center hexameric protein [Fimbriimonadaceae bacterium]|nr:Nif3-like dinuclear metal center hexameric protein [Fimbriimonadaceae bacterium]
MLSLPEFPTVGDVCRLIDSWAPPHLAYPWDRHGLQLGDPSAPAGRVMVSLDSDLTAIEATIQSGCGMLVVHHPLIWEPLKTLTEDAPRSRTILAAARAGLAVYGTHTAWDCAPNGLNDSLLQALHLCPAGAFGSDSGAAALTMVVHTSAESADAVVDAASQAGAGRIGGYERCAFQSPGEGTFLGGAETSPVVGQAGRVERVPEVRIEMVLPAAIRSRVEAAVRAAHPYEEPSIQFLQRAGSGGHPIGRLGRTEPIPLGLFAANAADALETREQIWGAEKPVGLIAVIGGAGGGEWWAAQAAGADVLLTGEVKHDEGVAAVEAGFAVVALGHEATEQPGMRHLAARLMDAGVQAVCHEPGPHRHGRCGLPR